MEKENLHIDFILQGIKTEQFAIFENNYEPKIDTGLGTTLQLKVDHTNNNIGIFLGFEFLQANKVVLKILVSCHFNIKNESWQSFQLKNEGELTIPKEFLAHLAMITVGITRGILFAKTEGTEYSKFIIPILNIAEMIPEDASFKIPDG